MKEMLWRSDRVEKRNRQADQGRDDGRQHTGVLERERERERERIIIAIVRNFWDTVWHIGGN